MSEQKQILVSGASGLIGRPLRKALESRGHGVRTLSRSSRGDYQWDVDSGHLDPAALEGVDAVVHLAGEGIAQRWTDAAKARILGSRVDGTKLLADAVLQRKQRPAFISASGISYYGIAQSEEVDEHSPSGDGFLAEVVRRWEGAAQPLVDAGVRTVFLRTGIVLSAKGGALAKMLPPFKMGVGGRVGSGRQRMSWVSLDDLVAMYVHVVESESLEGPVNAVAPEAVSNQEFTKVLGKVLGRPTIFPLPAAVVKALFGEMGRETILGDLAVSPGVLEASGFRWRHTKLEAALRATIQP